MRASGAGATVESLAPIRDREADWNAHSAGTIGKAAGSVRNDEESREDTLWNRSALTHVDRNLTVQMLPSLGWFLFVVYEGGRKVSIQKWKITYEEPFAAGSEGKMGTLS
jgi:hypothetical protein